MNAVIALVENDLPTNRALARLLRISGYTVAPFQSAEAFLAHCGEEAPDCLIVDIDLDGMSGLELQSELRLRRCRMPAIVVTGRCDPELPAIALALGCSDFLTKPVRAEALLDAILRALSSRAGTARPA